MPGSAANWSRRLRKRLTPALSALPTTRWCRAGASNARSGSDGAVAERRDASVRWDPDHRRLWQSSSAAASLRIAELALAVTVGPSTAVHIRKF